MSSKRCAITGAADGIGRALAGRFGRAGYALVGIDVDADGAAKAERELRSLGVNARFYVADLSNRAGVDEALRAIDAELPVDCFVHNAGINLVGRFAESDLAAQKRVVELNFTAPMHLTSQLLANGRIADDGSLVFVSSLSRFVGYPGAAGYAASKDGLASYARSMATALGPRGMHVLTVYPGPTRTAHARRYSPDNTREDRRMPPKELADLIFRAVERRQRVLIPGFSNRFFAVLGHVLPGVTEKAMKKTILDRLP